MNRDLETLELVRRLTGECERAARAFRIIHSQSPAQLRAWANRVEQCGSGESIVALSLESSARAGHEYLDT